MLQFLRSIAISGGTAVTLRWRRIWSWDSGNWDRIAAIAGALGVIVAIIFGLAALSGDPVIANPGPNGCRSRTPPLTNLLLISTRAPDDGSTTITDVDVRVYAREPMEGTALVSCQYGAGGEAGTSIFPNLDAPGGPIPMDVDNDGEPDTQLPGGRFFVAPGETENLSVLTEGQNGYVYELGLVVHADVNGQTQQEQFGTSEQPSDSPSTTLRLRRCPSTTGTYP